MRDTSVHPGHPAGQGGRWLGRSTWLASGLGAVAIGVAAALDVDTPEAGPVLCPFRMWTGLPCPACGLTRSWVLLLDGQWRESLSMHPLGPATVAATLLLIAVTLTNAVRRRPPPRHTECGETGLEGSMPLSPGIVRPAGARSARTRAHLGFVSRSRRTHV